MTKRKEKILILGNGNYSLILKKLLSDKYIIFSNNDKKQKQYDYTLVTYPLNILNKEKLKYIHSFNTKTIIHLATQGFCLAVYFEFIKNNKDISYIFCQKGPFLTRNGKLNYKYHKINLLMFNKKEKTKIFQDMKIKTQISNNISEFIYSFHNQILHPSIIALSHNTTDLYHYTSKLKISNMLQKISKSVYELNPYKKYSFEEFLVFIFYQSRISAFFVPLLMPKHIPIPTSKNHRLITEDILSLYYIYKFSEHENINLSNLEKIFSKYSKKFNLNYEVELKEIKTEFLPIKDLILKLEKRLIKF